MDLKQTKAKLVGGKDERAVSPVIGVILMVAITVILAAVIAAFVLDIGDLDDSAPNANFDYDVNSEGELEAISHSSGDSIDSNLIEIRVDGEVDPIDGGDWEDGDISAGDTLDLEDGDLENLGESTTTDDVAIIWESDGTSSTIGEWEE